MGMRSGAEGALLLFFISREIVPGDSGKTARHWPGIWAVLWKTETLKVRAQLL